MIRFQFRRVLRHTSNHSVLIICILVFVIIVLLFSSSRCSTLDDTEDEYFSQRIGEEEEEVLQFLEHFVPHMGRKGLYISEWHEERGLTSQFGQDAFLFDYIIGPLQEKRGEFPGFFVEFGARDGIEHSNTNFFEKSLGWRGILVEPVIAEFATLKKNRPNSYVYNGALCDHEGLMEFISVEGSGIGLSGFRKELEETDAIDLINMLVEEGTATMEVIEMNCLDLNLLLHRSETTKISLMSADCEGCERAVLEHHDWESFPIEILLLEFPKKKSNWRPLVKLLLSKGMRLLTIWVSDLVFVSKEISDEIIVH